jgi:hypothetical protein
VPARRLHGRPDFVAHHRAAVAALTLVLALGLLLLAADSSRGAVPFQEISSGGPLTKVSIGNELSCQVAHTGDPALELYPSGSTPGSCGTFIFDGTTLFAPDFANHDGSATSSLGATTPFTAVSQTPPSGAGTTAAPSKITTVADAGALRITEVDTYITGQESYRTDVTIANNGGAPANGIIYRAGDCYLQGDDQGYGFVDQARGAVGCSINANNDPAGRIEQWFPITPGNQYMETSYSTGWATIGSHQPLPNACECANRIDNWSGISWNYSVPPGGSATFSHYTTFSPTGVAGPPPPVSSGPAPPAFGQGGFVSAPSNRRCVSRRNFRIRIRRKRGFTIEQAIVFVNGRRVAVRKGRRLTARVDLRGLPKGRFRVRITVILSDGRVITGTRKYRTCSRKRRGRPGPV